MTGTERPGSLPVRGELAGDATVQFEETARAELRFSPNHDGGCDEPPVDPMGTAGRWLVTTVSGAMHLIESTAPDGAVTATRVTAGPPGDDPRFPRGTLRRDDEPVLVTGVQHLTGSTMSSGIVVGEDMYLYLEPLDPAADLTLRRTTPVVEVVPLPPVPGRG